MGNNKKRKIEVEFGDDNCPADALMKDFRERAKKSDYAKNVEFSGSCVDFFKEMADVFEESEKNIVFKWDEIPEEELPPLIVKLRKKDGKYLLQYLKELGDEVTLIKGKQRKGRNKNGQIKVIKKEEPKDIEEGEER